MAYTRGGSAEMWKWYVDEPGEVSFDERTDERADDTSLRRPSIN